MCRIMTCCTLLLWGSSAYANSLTARHSDLYTVACPSMDVPATYTLTPDQESSLVNYIRARMHHVVASTAQAPPWTLAPLPPFALHVTIRLEGRILGEGVGLGADLMANANSALGRALALAAAESETRNAPPLTPAVHNDVALEVSVFYDSEALDDRRLFALRDDFSKGVHGAGLWVDGRAALVPGAQWLRHKQTVRQFLQNLSMSTGQPADAFRKPTTTLWRFETVHLVQGHSAADVVRLTRGDRAVPISEVTMPRVRTWLDGMGQWLRRNVRETGRMEYMYHPEENRYHSQTNMIRQWMGTHALGALFAHTHDNDYASAFSRNVKYNLKTYYTDHGTFGAIHHKGQAKLGAAACAMMALLHAPDPESYRKPLDQLERLVIHLRQRDGSFATHLTPEEMHENEAFYSGEALVALAMYLETNPSDELRGMIAQSRDYYMPWYRTSGRIAAFVPWHTMAYWRMFRLTSDPAYSDAIYEMNDWLICLQDMESTDQPDILGRFYVDALRNQGVPHASSTGIYVEGLAYAYDLARRAGDADRAQAYLSAIRWGVRSLIQLQYRPENTMFVTQPDRVMGGIRTTVVDNRLRCDNTQHAIMAALAILRFVDAEAFVQPTPRARAFRAQAQQLYVKPE